MKCCCFIGRAQLYGLLTTCGAGLLASSCALTFCNPRSKRFNLLLLLRDSCFQVLAALAARLSLAAPHFAVLFEELVEQHRVHRFVAHGVDLAVLIAHHQIRIYLCHFLGDQTKLRRARVVALVMEVTGLSARIASLALSIGLISFLNRREELIVPSWPAESINDWYGVCRLPL